MNKTFVAENLISLALKGKDFLEIRWFHGIFTPLSADLSAVGRQGRLLGPGKRKIQSESLSIIHVS